MARARACRHDAFQLSLPGLVPPHCHHCGRTIETSCRTAVPERPRQPLHERARLMAQRYAELNPQSLAVLSAAAVMAAPQLRR